MSIVQFTLPFFCFLMVSSALLFSAHTFYVGLRKLLFPELNNDNDEEVGDDYAAV